MHIFPCFAIEERPELESQFKGCIWEAVKYACTINDFDELVDLRILPHHCLGSKPSHYVLHAIHREEKSESFQDETSPSSFQDETTSFMPYTKKDVGCKVLQLINTMKITKLLG